MDAKSYRRQLRQELTLAERKLWHAVRAKRFQNLKIRRQHTIGPFTVDFYCPAARLVIELDGDVHLHTGQDLYDQLRQETIETMGYRVIRFTNEQVFHSLEEVLFQIEKETFV